MDSQNQVRGTFIQAGVYSAKYGTVKLVNNDHPWMQSKVVFVERWSLFGGSSPWRP